MHENAYCRIDSFSVLRQSFGGKLKLSVESGHKLETGEGLPGRQARIPERGDLKPSKTAQRSESAV